MSIALQPINERNWEDCVRLRVPPDQISFVAPNAYSLAQAAYERDCVPLAIYNGDEMVGFAMYWHESGDRTYHISRLMVDARYQRQGYGRGGMEQLMSHLRAQPDCEAIDISYLPDNEVARRLYISFGFRETGELDPDGEVIARWTRNS